MTYGNTASRCLSIKYATILKTFPKSDRLLGSGRSEGSHIESSAVKQDAHTVVGEVAQASRIGLDGLELGVEALGKGFGVGVFIVGEEPDQVSLEHTGYVLEGLELAAGHSVIPLRDEVGSGHGVALAPELHEDLFVAPRRRGLQVALAEFVEGECTHALGQGPLQPQKLGPGEAGVATLAQAAMFLAALCRRPR